MADESHYDRLRSRMVTTQIEGRLVRDSRLLDAMRAIPRHRFVPRDNWDSAYDDHPVPIGEDQTISQPYIVALMTQLLDLLGEENVLEVGTGSGYQAAILAALAKHVYTLERHKTLADRAAVVLRELGIENVTVKCGDGSQGWLEHAPYDAIMVTAAAPTVPPPLLEQLSEIGRIVLPVGGFGMQYLQVWRREGAGYVHDDIVPVAFVPLRGKYGWEKGWYD